MKTILCAAALALVTLASHAQAEQPAVLRGVTKKQTLTTQQMRTVRGEGLGLCAIAKVKVNACVNANVNVPCLLNVNAHVPVNVNVGAHAGALVGL